MTNNNKHVPYDYAHCECNCCKNTRDKSKLQRLQKLHEQQLENTFGKNFKNIMVGLGDQ